jgi:Global regulator protein family
MLVLTRRPGEAIQIGDNIEILIVDVDGKDLETRCAISVIGADGDDLRLQDVKRADGVTVIRSME